MREEEKEFIKVMDSFHKLKMSSILPGISNMEFGILKTIDHIQSEKERRVKISDLANGLKASPPAISRCLKGLESKGYLMRNVDPKDRRNTYVDLTEDGKVVLQEANQIMDGFCQAVVGNMGEADMKMLILYLKKLRETIRQEIEHVKMNNRKDETEDE